jgi:AraC family transcriptional regulator, regulatory protein of adaptative response / DNA-3-methyladenine glycosylase II
MDLDDDACYRAIQVRDRRFDGRLFIAVRTTGIYCRPICPARTPKRENSRFYATAAAAQEAGYRPCLRCRPESCPDLAFWRGTSNTVSRALDLIEGGALDTGDVDSLAERLGMGERQLRRLFKQHLGASPISVAQTRRVLLAKKLIHETRLPMIEVAMASGFGSVRRFNETFQRLYHRPPSELRRGSAPEASAGPAGEVSLRLPYREPYDWPAMFAALAARAIPGIETVDEQGYGRMIALDGAQGTIHVAPGEGAFAQVTVRFPQLRSLPSIIARIRRVFDFAADPVVIGAQLAEDPLLAPLVKRRPGLRVPGAWGGFELAVRAMLPDRQALAALLATHGVFPEPGELATRRNLPPAIRTLVRAFAGGQLEDANAIEACGVPRVTAEYIAAWHRREPDAFHAGDADLARAVVALGGDPRDLCARAERWRPWRAYAAAHLLSIDLEAHHARRAA